MKRIFCLVIVLMMCVSTVVFADDYDFFSTSYNSYEADISVTMTVNEPMTVLNLISQISGIDNFVNLQLLAESICNSTTTGVIKLNSSSDYTKAKVSYEISEVVPVDINRNFRLTAEMKIGMWVEWDISDELNPVFKYIMQQPLADKYISVDLVELMEEAGISAPDFISSIKGYMQKDYLDSLNLKMTDIWRNNSVLTKTGNKVTITLTDEQLENMIADLMDFVIEEFDDNEDYNLLYDGETGYISEILPNSEDVKKFFDKYNFFDETAIVMEYTTTPAGALKTSSACINMDIDMKKVLEELGIQDFSSGDSLKFSVKSDVEYKSVNGNVNVEFPVLSEEDIIDFEDFLYVDYDYAYEWDTENCYHDESDYLYVDYVPAAKDTFYVPIKEITDYGNYYGYNYDLSLNGADVVLKETSGKDVFSEVKMTIDSNEITVDGTAFTLPNPVIMSGGLLYVDTCALKNIFGFEIGYARIDLEPNELSIRLERRSPQCHHTDEEINSWEDDYYDGYDEYIDECEHYQYCYVASEYPYDGIPYVKLRDVLDEMYYYNEDSYGVVYDNGVVTITDNTGTENFESIVFTVGSSTCVVDGVEKTVGAEVVEYYDSLYVDIAMIIDIFEFELSDSALYYGAYYDEATNTESFRLTYETGMERKLPTCTHNNEELTENEIWWE